jgi:hypothetical protein
VTFKDQDELGIYPLLQYRGGFRDYPTYRRFGCHLTPEDIAIRAAAIERTRNAAGQSSAFSFLYYASDEVWR